MIEAAHDGEADGEAGGPAGEDHGEGGRGVVPVLAVEDGRGYREEPEKMLDVTRRDFENLPSHPW